jgi:dihydroorotate dehydrogenase
VRRSGRSPLRRLADTPHAGTHPTHRTDDAMLYQLVRPLLFSLDAETAHELTISALHALGRLLPPGKPEPADAVTLMGLTFPNRIGLAAGLDKNGEAIDGLARLGFGFLEVGTVTPRAQPGNPRPRMFRLPDAQAIINRMGFNNHGVDALVANVKAARYRGILGINIGKNFDTPIERAADDYLTCLDKVYPLASYVTVNISSPNTQNLRQLQGASELDDLLGRLKARQQALADTHGRFVPLVLKIAPDLAAEQLTTIADALRRHRIDAVIATNTTLARDKVQGLRFADQQGGLSGAPVFEASTAIVAQLAQALGGELPIIAAGGVLSGADARAKLAAGASLVQLYSGLVYRGPELVRECVRATAHHDAGSGIAA